MDFEQGKKKRFTTNHLFGALVLILFIGNIILFTRQEKMIDENRELALLAQRTAQSSIDQTNLSLGNVKDDLAQFKVKSAEEVAAAEKKAAEQASLVEQIRDKPVIVAPTVSGIVKSWQPVIARVTCEFRYANGNLYARQSGSATLLSFTNGSRSLITNKHVVSDIDGYGPSNCAIKFPNDAAVYNIGVADITLSTKGSDMATIATTSIPTSIGGKTKRNYCASIPDVGSTIVILGYPSIGSNVDVTATEGIVSGYEGSYYVTSAKVEHGNSGGAAIDLTNNCYLGIPTFVQTGQIESLARVLKWQAF
ncbi:MAG: trypsin-like peptidase domain-containing protein [Candidatus Pacebacteria bacterium]|nr:trypsin-like peptidase domain-containing protein [Candidatus Paceibacterota bacterium]